MKPCRYTVSICTHNHADQLATTLPTLSALRAPASAWELLIVDNASSDATSELLARTDWHVAGIDNRVVREEELGVANARNRAVTESRGEYVLFLDDDETPDPDWLGAMERHIDRYAPDAIGGPYRVIFEGAPRPAWLQDDLLGFLGALDHGPQAMPLTNPATQIYTGNAAFSKLALAKHGLFDPTLGRRGNNRAGGEDTEMYRRLLAAGCNLRWAPDAVIYHRIRAEKLSRRFFLDLHYEQGKLEGAIKRGRGARVPPLWSLGYLVRAFARALRKRLREGGDRSLRFEMNVLHAAGLLAGWAFGPLIETGSGDAPPDAARPS